MAHSYYPSTWEKEAGGTQEIAANPTSTMRPFLTKDTGTWEMAGGIRHLLLSLRTSVLSSAPT